MQIKMVMKIKTSLKGRENEKKKTRGVEIWVEKKAMEESKL